ncbi:MAG: hypothetical protein ABH803_01270 [Candidatus Micrarchaeota archaeon]
MDFNSFVSSLKEGYYSLEDKYYSLIDSLSERGINLNKYFVEPLEERGIPSFPVFVFLLFLILLSLFSLLFSGFQQPVSLQVIVESDGLKLNGVQVELLRDGVVFASDNTVNGSVMFTDLKPEKVTVKATKRGYSVGEDLIDLAVKSSISFSLTCTSSLCSGIGDPIPPIIPNPGDSYIGFDPGSDVGVLNVVVRNEAGDYIEASVQVIDARTDVVLDGGVSLGGSFPVLDLPVGSSIFVNVQADGYLPFDGSENITNIVSGLNPYLVTLVLATEENSGTSVVSVVNTLGVPIKDAKVSVFLNNGNSTNPIYPGVYTNVEGKTEFLLATGLEYVAFVQKTGFSYGVSEVFSAGESVNVTLTEASEADLTVLVVDSDDDEVSGVSVSVFYGRFLVDYGVTGIDGSELFEGLVRDASYVVKASNGNRNAEGTIVLTQEQNQLKLILQDVPAVITVQAVDYITLAPLPSASFQAFLDENKVAECSGVDCELIVPPGNIVVNASAVGFVSSEQELLVFPGELIHLQIKLLNEDLLDDSFVVFKGVKTLEGRLISDGKLLQGKSYTVELELFSVDADETGVFFTFDDSLKAFISDAKPIGFSNKVSEDASCTFDEVTSFEEGSEYSWVQLEYSGEVHKTISIDFTVRPDISLDPTTGTIDLDLSYRSFIVRDGNWLRNPFEKRCGLDADQTSGLESCCNAELITQAFVVGDPARSCTAFGCINLFFQQGDKFGAQDFTIESILNLDNPQEYTPASAFFTIELFKPLDAYSDFKFSFPEGFISVDGVEIPLNETISKGVIYCDGWNFEPVITNAEGKLEIDLSGLKDCSNYNPSSHYSFGGVISLKPLRTISNSFVDLRVSTNPFGGQAPVGDGDTGDDVYENTKQVYHRASINTIVDNYAADDYREIFLDLSQTGNEQPEQGVFNAISLIDLQANVKIRALKPILSTSKLSLVSDNVSVLELTGRPVTGGEVYGNPKLVVYEDGKGFYVEFASLQEGDYAFGTALFQTRVGATKLFLVHEVLDSSKPTLSVNRDVIVSKEGSPSVFGLISFTKFSQQQDGEEKTGGEPFPALKCVNQDCEGEAVTINFEALSSISSSNAFLKIYSDSPAGVVVSATAQLGTNLFGLQGDKINIGSINANDKITGSIKVNPIDAGLVKIFVELHNGGLAFNDADLAISEEIQGGIGPFNYGGNCGSTVEVEHTTQGLWVSCSELSMYLSKAFSGDVAQVTFTPLFDGDELLISTNPSSFDSCISNKATMFNVGYLKLDASKTGCGLSKIFEDRETINFELSFAPKTSLNDIKKVKVVVNLVSPQENVFASGLSLINVLPLENPELWVLVNNKQFGSRKVGINDKEVSLNKPETIAFGVSNSVELTDDGEAFSEGLIEQRTGNQDSFNAWLGQFRIRAEGFWKAVTWRSQRQLMYCTQDYSDCRPIESWLKYTVKETVRRVSCTNACIPGNEYPVAPYTCDARCNKDGTAEIYQGESMTNSAGKWVTCVPVKCDDEECYCELSCNSYCGLPKCDPDCVGGLKEVTEYTYSVEWQNSTDLIEVMQNSELDIPGKYPYEAFNGKISASKPFEYREVAFVPKNALIQLQGVTVHLNDPVVDTDACTSSFEGVYEFKASFNGVKWSLVLTPLSLITENYVGDSCDKGIDTPLCGFLYADSSNEYGSCINSFQHLFTDNSVSEMKRACPKVKNADLRSLLDSGLRGVGDGSYDLYPSQFVLSSNGFFVLSDGRYDCELLTSNGRYHYLFWNPLGEVTNVYAYPIEGCSAFTSNTPDGWVKDGASLSTPIISSSVVSVDPCSGKHVITSSG